jgi:hypothetical protein
MKQLKSIRLIVEKAKEGFTRAGLDFPDEAEVALCGYPVHVSIGDEMTGWEIIASLPLALQQNVYDGDLPQAMKTLYFINRSKYEEEVEAFTKMAGALYRWNGVSWEAVKE